MIQESPILHRGRLTRGGPPLVCSCDQAPLSRENTQVSLAACRSFSGVSVYLKREHAVGCSSRCRMLFAG